MAATKHPVGCEVIRRIEYETSEEGKLFQELAGMSSEYEDDGALSSRTVEELDFE